MIFPAGENISNMSSHQTGSLQDTFEMAIIFCRRPPVTIAGIELSGMMMTDVVPPAAAALVPVMNPADQ